MIKLSALLYSRGRDRISLVRRSSPSISPDESSDALAREEVTARRFFWKSGLPIYLYSSVQDLAYSVSLARRSSLANLLGSTSASLREWIKPADNYNHKKLSPNLSLPLHHLQRRSRNIHLIEVEGLISLRVHLGPRPSRSQPGETVGLRRGGRVVVVLPARVLEGCDGVQAGAGPEGYDGSVHRLKGIGESGRLARKKEKKKEKDGHTQSRAPSCTTSGTSPSKPSSGSTPQYTP